MKTFCHSGDLGDLVFSLPTIRALTPKGEQAELYLVPDNRCRQPFTLPHAYNIGTLLMQQPYIRRWSIGAPENIKFDYDFREWRTAYDGHSNLAYSQAKHFGVDPSVADEPWLTVEQPVTCRPAGMSTLPAVVVCRSHRYRQHDFPWNEIADRYRDSAIVIGTRSEAEELRYLYGFNNYAETSTLLDAARIIAGADLVISNATCSYAIAEGLKKTVLFERWPVYTNVDFDRPGVYTGERVMQYLTNAPAKVVAAPVAAPKISGTRRPEAAAV